LRTLYGQVNETLLKLDYPIRSFAAFISKKGFPLQFLMQQNIY